MDDFTWLPEALSGMAGSSRVRPPIRVEYATPDGSISALKWGDGEGPVFLHGGGQNAHTWDLVVALLGGEALAIDLPGHGHSSWRADRDYRPYSVAPALADIFDIPAPRPRPFVGMSLGGLAALALADLRGDLVEELVLVDILPGGEKSASRLSRSDQGQVALTRGPREFDSIEDMISQASDLAPGRPTVVLERGVRHNAVRMPSGRWRWRYDVLETVTSSADDTARMWDAIARIPRVLLLLGGNSRFVQPEQVERLRERNPGAVITVVPDAGHSVQSDAALAAARAIEVFLTDSSDPTRRYPACQGEHDPRRKGRETP